MTKKKKNASKKLPKNLSGSMPYFLINSLGEIQHFEFGGDLSVEDEGSPNILDAMTAVGGGGIGSTIGDTFSNMIGGNTNIAEDRSAGKGAAVTGGVFEGAGTGWDVGGVAGLVVGGVAGGINAGNQKEKEIEAFKNTMEQKYQGYSPDTTSYLGAYGGELPDMLAFGGGIGDPPITNTDTSPSMINNPNYEEQLKLYRESLTRRPQDSLSATADEEFIKNFVSHRDKNFPTQAGLNINKLVYDPNMVDPNTGIPTQYLEYFDKPASQIEAPRPTASMPKPDPVKPVMLDASTGKALPNMPLMDEGQQINRQYSQSLEQSHNTPEAIAKREALSARMDARKAELASMTEEEKRLQRGDLSRSELIAKQRAEFQAANQRAMGGPVGEELNFGGDATNFNGNSHDEGGIKIGKVEVEDGEIRVGDYVFSDRLTNQNGRTFAEEAKKVVGKFEEYPNDGPAKRTQNKMLEEIKYQNDQARLLKQKEDAEMRMAMGEDFAAYGGMIQKDSRGKYLVDKNNRMELMDAAKNRKMSYNKYIDSLYAYGGDIGVDPKDKNGADPMANPAPGPIQYDFPGLDMSTPNAPEDINLMDFGLGPEIPGVRSPLMDAMAGLPALGSDTNTSTDPRQSFLDKVKDNFNEEEQALLSSQLPNLAQLATAGRRGNTTFDRVRLGEVNLDSDRRQVESSIDKARRVQRENVRGTATSAGEALSALSAGNAGLTQAEMDAMTGINERERNANIQINNQENMTNVGISNQETIARQQDDAMRDSVKQLALSGMSDNYQGYIKDKKMSKENEASNKRLLSLLDTGEYEIVEDGEGGYKVSYKTKKAE